MAEAIGGSVRDRAVVSLAETLDLGLPWGASVRDNPCAFEEIATALVPLLSPYLGDEATCREQIARLLNGDPADHLVRNLLSRVKALRESL